MLESDLILIVEDEPLIAMSIEDCVRDIGMTPATAPGLAHALALAHDADLTAAVLDISLPDGASAAVADVLRSRRVPFVVSTGSAIDRLPQAFEGAPILTKPYPDDDLRKLLADVVRTARETI